MSSNTTQHDDIASSRTDIPACPACGSRLRWTETRGLCECIHCDRRIEAVRLAEVTD
jgi:ribosomal protein L37AE/L43A